MKKKCIKLCGIVSLCYFTLTTMGCKQPVKEVQPPVKVTVWKAEATAFSGEQEFSATIEENFGSTLSFPVGGTIKQIYVEAGRRVGKGELIATIDETSLRNAYEASQAVLIQAQDAYQRMKQLHDAGSLPEIQWVEVQSKLRQAQSAASISKKSLADGRLYAPFSGVISEKNAEIGQNLMPGQPVVHLVKIDKVKVKVSVPENEIAHIRLGQPVNINVQALDGRTFFGKIAEKGVVANALSRSYDVKAIVDNPSGALMPGMLCTMSFGHATASTAISLPTSVVQTDESNHTFVWVCEGGKAHKKMVQTGPLSSNKVVILQGLNIGSEVIVEGQQKVSEGTLVTTKH